MAIAPPSTIVSAIARALDIDPSLARGFSFSVAYDEIAVVQAELLVSRDQADRIMRVFRALHWEEARPELMSEIDDEKA